jgi:hypothetical protein
MTQLREMEYLVHFFEKRMSEGVHAQNKPADSATSVYGACSMDDLVQCICSKPPVAIVSSAPFPRSLDLPASYLLDVLD